MCSAISPGTERLVFSGRVPPSLHESMKCPYMGGDFSFPVKYGYSLVGRVVSGAAPLIGKIGHVLHPHQERCVVRASDVYVFPENIPPQRAALASNMETAVNALWDSRMSLGDRALVVGFGAVGALVARLAAGVPGSELWVVDSEPAKVELARRMGFSACAPQELRGLFDVVFQASASASGLELALASSGFEGRVIELSWYGTEGVSLPLGREFHQRRLKIVSSQVSSLSPAQGARWDFGRRKGLVFRLLQDPWFDGHSSEVVPFADLPEAYPKTMRSPNPGLGYIIKYEQRSKNV
jgi:threonine dehydrogenase-like Zn-dependent dehydrogenase